MAILIDNPCNVEIITTQVYPNSATTVFTTWGSSPCASGLITDGIITATTITKIGKENTTQFPITVIPTNGSSFRGWGGVGATTGKEGVFIPVGTNTVIFTVRDTAPWYAVFDRDCSFGVSDFCYNTDKDKLCSSCENQKKVYFDNENDQYFNKGITNNSFWYGTQTLETLITFSGVSSTNRVGWSFNLSSSEISGGGTFKEVAEGDYKEGLAKCNRELKTKIIKLQCLPSNLNIPYVVFLYKNGEKLYKFNGVGNSDIEILNIRGNPNDINYSNYKLKYVSKDNQTITFKLFTETIFEKSTSGVLCNGGYVNYNSTVSVRPSLSGLIVPDGFYSQIINGYNSQYSVIYQIFNGLIIDKSYCGSDILQCNGTTGTIPNTTTIKGTNYNRTWSSKNLDVTHYKNGDPIPLVTGTTEWSKLTTGAYCYYNNDKSNSDTYGLLYNWYAVNDKRGLAPTGWKIPTDLEWSTLRNTLGVTSGGRLKKTGTTNWLSPNLGATNDTSFTALPGGFRNVAWSYKTFNYGQNAFTDLNRVGYWWSSNNSDIGPYGPHAGFVKISYDSIFFDVRFVSSNAGYNKSAGLSIRLIRD